MVFLPIENIVLQSKLPKAEVVKRLVEKVDVTNTKPYVGSVTADGFQIKRVIDYRNSFLPKITGQIEESIGGTKLTVKMRLESLVAGFMVVWLGGMTIASAFTIHSVIHGAPWDFGNVLPFGMLLFGIVLTLGAFKAESARSLNDLRKILEAEILK